MNPYVAQRADHQRLAWIGDSTIEVLLDAQRTGGQLMVTTSTMRRGDAAPLHVHAGEDEAFIMLSGSGTFWAGDSRYVVEEGGVAWLPRDLPHTYRIDSDTAQVMTLCTPGGFEGFFRTAGYDRSVEQPEGWALTPATMGAALAGHGGTILGPPKGPQD